MHEKEVCERVSQHFQYLEDYQFSQVLLYNSFFYLVVLKQWSSSNFCNVTYLYLLVLVDKTEHHQNGCNI